MHSVDVEHGTFTPGPLVLSLSLSWVVLMRQTSGTREGFSAIYKVESALQCHHGLVEMLLVILSPSLFHNEHQRDSIFWRLHHQVSYPGYGSGLIGIWT